jgi:hypothetical protein
MKKKFKYKILFTLMSIVAFNFFVFSPISALAVDKEGWKKSGITSGGSLKDSTIYTDLENIVYFIMAIGGFWVIACLLFAGMKLSAAQGNPQARTQGFVGLAMSALGMFVIVKAWEIAGWVAGFGL